MNPSTYTQALADEICARLSVGEPLAQICRDDHMPAKRTVSDWKKAHPDFKAAVDDARDEGYDFIAADCLKIADHTADDFIPTDKGMAFNAEHVQRSKLRIETRLKLLAKWDPRRYGDKLTLAGDAENPLHAVAMTVEQFRAAAEEIAAKV